MGQQGIDSAARPRISRSWLEATGWLVVVAVLWGTDLLAKWSERNQSGVGKDDFRLISEQVTSAIAVLVMIAFVIRWLRVFPLRRDHWVQALVGHAAGTVIFAFGHHVLMIAMRVPWYALNGRDYVWREPFVGNLITEFQKDIKVYLGILLIATLYRSYRRRGSTPPPVGPDRLVVQAGNTTAILPFEQIDYVEAARNYVSVYAAGREYVVRETMANVERRLSEGPFLRVHRSFIVNVDKVHEYRTVESRQFVRLTNGSEVPVGRAFRDELTRRLETPTA
jgi:hypothetical protein